MVKPAIILVCFQAVLFSSFGQLRTADSLKPNKKRVIAVTAFHTVVWAGSHLALNNAWYADYARTSFHSFNDLSEWNQMDKAGHIWSSYQVARGSAELWKWSGLGRNRSAILGGISGIAYESIIEIQDGYSSKWGFSWSDMAANLAGSGIFVLEETLWKEQRIQVKMNYWPARYSGELKARRDQLFSKTLPERILKDYNSQIYWFSANISSFIPKTGFPSWLNIAVGYGSGGLYGGRENTWTNNEGAAMDYTGIPRERRILVSPDIDLTKIKTRSKALRSVFFLFNCIKMPAPAIEWSSKGKISFHAFR